jgi:hypothetical protein
MEDKGISVLRLFPHSLTTPQESVQQIKTRERYNESRRESEKKLGKRRAG